MIVEITFFKCQFSLRSDNGNRIDVIRQRPFKMPPDNDIDDCIGFLVGFMKMGNGTPDRNNAAF